MVNPITNTFIFISLFLFSAGALSQTAARPSSRTKVKPPVVKRLSFSYQTGVVFWGQQLTLLTSDKRTEDVIVELKGVGLGVEADWKYTRTGPWRTTLAVKGSFLQGQAQSVGATITYKEPINSNILISADAGQRYYPHENVFLGLGLGMIFNEVKLKPQSSVIAQYEFEYSNPLRLFANFNMGWKFTENLYVYQSIFTAANAKGLAGWNISIGYTN